MSVEYEIKVMKEQIAVLEKALNEVRLASGLPKIQLPKSHSTARPDSR